jgi:hypothetical protein
MQQDQRVVWRPGLSTTRWRKASLAVALTVAVAACGGADDAGDETAPTTQAAATSAPTTQAAATTAPSTTAGRTVTSSTARSATTLPTATTGKGVPEVATFNVGQKATYNDGSSVQVFSVEQPYVDPTSIIGAPAGKQLASINVEVCLGSRATTTFAATAWTAYPASGGALQARLTSRLPAFLGGGPTTSGSCAKGYVGALADIDTPAAWVVWTQPGWEPARFKV